MVRLSSAVCAMIGVWVLDSTVPLDSRKFNRCGICSRSDGTFGLSREKCTLSNTRLMTCLTPLPRLQLDDSDCGTATAGVSAVTATTVEVNNAAADSAATVRRLGAAFTRMTNLS